MKKAMEGLDWGGEVGIRLGWRGLGWSRVERFGVRLGWRGWIGVKRIRLEWSEEVGSGLGWRGGSWIGR